MQLAAGHLAISVRIAAFDVEQHKIDVLKVGVISAVAKEAGSIERRVQAELPGCGEQAAGEADLYQRLATRDGEAAPRGAQGRGEVPEPSDRLRQFDPGAVLDVPGVGIVTVEAAQQAARHEEHQPDARPVDG